MARIDPETSINLKNGKSITGANYADMAERAIREGAGFRTGREELTTTSLRSIYGLIVNIYAEISDEEGFAQLRGDIQYLKIRMAYEAGRKKPVKVFLEQTGLMDALDSVTDYGQFLLYCRYAESLVAYFKFYGG